MAKVYNGNSRQGKSHFGTGVRKTFESEYPEELEDTDTDEEQITKKWYTEFPNDADEFPEPSEEQVESLKREAQKYFEGEISSYNLKVSRSSKQSDLGWMRTMMANGTTADKIAAYTLMIQESPIHNLNTLQSFINMVKIGKKEGLQVISTVTELFLSDLLPPDRKLRVFAACPLTLLDKMCSGNQVTRKKHLVRWYFENQLKDLYHEFLGHLNVAARDSIEANKEKAIMAMYKLLAGNPEKESVCVGQIQYEIPLATTNCAEFVIMHMLSQQGNL